VFVVDMTITLLLSGPTLVMIATFRVGALPWTGVSLLVLGEVTRALELLVTHGTRVHNISGLVRFATTGHGPADIVVVHVVVSERSLDARRAALVSSIEVAVFGEGNHLPILLPNELGWLAVMA
jgi:hypothetical protein